VSGFLPGEQRTFFQGRVTGECAVAGSAICGGGARGRDRSIDLASDLAQYKIRLPMKRLSRWPSSLNPTGRKPSGRERSGTRRCRDLTCRLVAAEITQVSSTTTTMDIGQGVPVGYGVEVRARTRAGAG